ncbi:MAG: PIG-L family deacetylase [Spirochaetes bacterium]|jgi:LmbE family N-acetylglucosaminyl deacetylase|nr:PIG-L family deacetylase [Spirochaetota bacterium]
MTGFSEWANTGPALVVAAHPDDEVLGCGATMAALADAGVRVETVFLTDGEYARTGATPADVQRRQAAADRAQELLGGAGVTFGDFPDNRLDSVPLLEIVQFIEAAVERVLPRLVLTHHSGDLNVDHEVAARAVLTACRPIPESTVREILAFEVLSATGWGTAGVASFQPTVFWAVKHTFQRKIAALQAYQEEMRQAPHARSMEAVRALAAHRGSSVGVPLAEAFELVRLVRQPGSTEGN